MSDKPKSMSYKEVADQLEENGHKEAADKLRDTFLNKSSLYQKALEKWKPLNTVLKIGIAALFYAGIVLFFEGWYDYGLVRVLKGTIDTLGIIGLIGGACAFVVGLIIHFEKKNG